MCRRHGEIDPREPVSYLRFSQTPPSVRVSDDIFFEESSNPDLTWLVSYQDVYDFAVKRWPKEWFDSLISPTNGKEKLSKQLKEDVDTRERETLLSIIAALCEMAGTTPEKRGLPAELARITQTLGVERGPDAISRHLKKAAEITR